MQGPAIPQFLSHLPKTTLDFGVMIALATGVAKTFEWFDPSLSKDSRVALGRLLTNLPPDKAVKSWSAVFPSFIDRVFGPRPGSWHFIRRSCLASMIAVTIVTFVYLRVTERPKGDDGFYYFAILTVMLISLVTNCVPDYFSLLISRFFVKLLSRNQTIKKTIGVLIADLLATATFAFCILWLVDSFLEFTALHGFVLPLHSLPDVLESSFGQTLKEIRECLHPDESNILILLLSPFFTSIWLWLYILSLGVFKVVHKAFSGWARIAPYLDLQEKPLVALGRVAGVIAAIGYASFVGVLWIFRHMH